MQMQAALGHIQGDHVAVLHQGQGAASCGFWRGVQHHGAVGCSAHTRIADAHHVGNAFAQDFWGQRHIADFGHAGIAFGSAVFEHQDAVFVDVQVFVIDTGVEVVAALKHHSASGVRHQGRRCGTRFDHGTTRRQVATQDRDARFFFEGFSKRLDDLGVVVLCIGNVLADGFAVGSDHLGMQEMRDFFHHRGQSACVAEVFHQILTRRLEVHQAR